MGDWEKIDYKKWKVIGVCPIQKYAHNKEELLFPKKLLKKIDRPFI